jgi:hypothetical protein
LFGRWVRAASERWALDLPLGLLEPEFLSWLAEYATEEERAR